MLPVVLPGIRSLTPAVLVLVAAASCSGESQTYFHDGGGTSIYAAGSAQFGSESIPVETLADRGTMIDAADSSSLAEHQDVLAAHDRSIAAYQRAASASDPSDAEFKRLFTPEALKELQIRIQQRKDNGVSVRGAEPSVSRIQYLAVVVTGADATLTTCEVDDRIVYRIDDGSVLNDEVTTSRWTVQMSLADGTWMVSKRQETQTWDGEEMATCVSAARP